MGFFEQIFGTELGLPTRAVVALILVLALIALTVWLMRRFGDGRIVTQSGGRGHQQRLAVLDKAVVDARRRLVLIRRDNVEHLILIGGPSDVVVEQNIVRAAPATGAMRPIPRPAGIEEESAPPIQEILPLEPEPAPPSAAPRPATPSPAPAPAAAPTDATPPAPAARPAAKLDPQYAEMAQRLEAALGKPPAKAEAPRPAPAPSPAPRAAEPRMPDPRPAPADAQRAPMPRISDTRPGDPWFETPRPPAATPAPPSQPAQAARTDQSPSDVFASLEEEMASLLRPGATKDPRK